MNHNINNTLVEAPPRSLMPTKAEGEQYLKSFGCKSLNDLVEEFDEAILDQPDYQEKFEAAFDAFDAWSQGGDEIPDDLLPYLTWSARRYRLGVEYGEIPNPRNWLNSSVDFLQAELPPRASYLVDKETGATVFYESSLNQIFAFTGVSGCALGPQDNGACC